MFAVICIKLSVPKVADCLHETGGAPIIEVSRNDSFWGAVPAHDTFIGTNLLGRMWMAIRRIERARSPALQTWPQDQSIELWPHLC